MKNDPTAPGERLARPESLAEGAFMMAELQNLRETKLAWLRDVVRWFKHFPEISVKDAQEFCRELDAEFHKAEFLARTWLDTLSAEQRADFPGLVTASEGILAQNAEVAGLLHSIGLKSECHG